MAELSSRLNKTIGKSKLELEDATAEYRSIVERVLRDVSEGGSELSIAASEALLAGGKRIRPIIALLTCEAVCGSYQRAIPVAVAYELAHTASLVQDDIIDDSSLRRKKPTIHKKYGMIRAILVSDHLIFDIFSELAKYDRVKISKRRLAQLLLYLANSAKMATRGEFLEAGLATKSEVTEKEYLEIVGLKTAALFAAPAASGAIAGGGSKRVVDSMYQFGYYLGMCFQVMDDMLDIVGNKRDIGKPILKDLQNNTCNIAVVHALSKADLYQRNMIHSMLWRRWFAPSDVRKIVSTLKELGSLDYATTLANRYSSMSKEMLRILPASGARERLERLTHALEARRE
ncbi:MAG: polyprenyl synthetase family protein [Thaumarchaeota archaeon]|nr:polyprenyl synthetase family protein [Nitrososphaerota archaeon]